jgi:hypothetical protein
MVWKIVNKIDSIPNQNFNQVGVESDYVGTCVHI